jgi:hypothetical protein
MKLHDNKHLMHILNEFSGFIFKEVFIDGDTTHLYLTKGNLTISICWSYIEGNLDSILYFIKKGEYRLNKDDKGYFWCNGVAPDYNFFKDESEDSRADYINVLEVAEEEMEIVNLCNRLIN